MERRARGARREKCCTRILCGLCGLCVRTLSSGRRLERELQRELHDTRIAGGLNLAEARAIERRHQWRGGGPGRYGAKVHVIDHVEHLPPELHRLRAGELEGPGQREVVLEVARVDDRERPQIAVG